MTSETIEVGERQQEKLNVGALEGIVSDALRKRESARNPIWRDALSRLAAAADHVRLLKLQSQDSTSTDHSSAAETAESVPPQLQPGRPRD
jgi:hypothetical protein